MFSRVGLAAHFPQLLVAFLFAIFSCALIWPRFGAITTAATAVTVERSRYAFDTRRRFFAHLDRSGWEEVFGPGGILLLGIG